MVRLREIPRTAAFTWSPGITAPLIATGTKSGAVTADFSNDTCLEIWDLALDDEHQDPELQPLAKFETDAGFHDLAWTQFNESLPRGVIAGGLENGSLDLLDAEKLLGQQSEPKIAQMQKHSGAIKTLQFNPKHPNLIATGGAKGELFVTDLNNVSQPVRLGSTVARADDIDCLDWNKKVANIMVTGSSGGFVTVWDMKTKKESLTLNNMGRKAVSAVAWDPEKSTKLITATPLEQDPVILVWDLRNSNAPEKTLKGHDSGVLSLSWCVQDSDLLLSCGKDNRTILWNPQTGTAYGDYPVVTNWTFQTRWNPRNPNLFATASFDGKLAIQTLQNTGTTSSQTSSNQSQALDGEDFFSKAQTQPQAASFSLPKAPKWLERPVSVSFGFGGRIASVKPSGASASRASIVTISKYEADSSLGSSTESFEKAIRSGDYKKICEAKISEASSAEEKADWKVIDTLFSRDSRSKLIEYLGFSNETDEAADGIAKLEVSDEKEKSDSLAAPQVNGTANKHKRMSSMFDTGNDADEDFLLDLAASKGAKTNSPFKIFTGSESEADRRITRALMLGDFEKALDVCLEEDRMSDAFMFAICGGEASIAKVQEAYFAKQSSGPNYLRLLASVVGKNLWDTVHNADLANWKEIMATLCSFANQKEFPDLCEALGDRLEEQLKDNSSAVSRNDASFCFLAGSKLDKVVDIWIHELHDAETENTASESGSSAFSIHAQGLQRLIEKVTVFRRVTNYQDPELRDTSKTSDWKLDALYKKYLEYADVIAAHGQLQLAEQYLDLLPTNYPEADVARSRVKQATRKAAPDVSRAAQTTTNSRSKPLPSTDNFRAQQTTFSPVNQPSANSYAPPTSSQPSNPYAPPTNAQPPNPYAPSGGYQPAQPMGYQTQQWEGSGLAAPPQTFGNTLGRPPVAPPPRSFNQSPSIPPPSRATNMTNWNDIPENFGKPPTSRRGTPGAGNQPLSSPFPGQPPMSAQAPPPSQPGPYGARQKSMPPVPPPPKGAAPPPRITSPLASGPIERPPSASINAYTPSPSATASPPAPVGQHVMQPPSYRGPSLYNAPPSGPPPTNRYAPNPVQQQSGLPPPQARQPIPPPPQASPYQPVPPPTNPYAPSRAPAAAPLANPYTPTAPPQQTMPLPAQMAPPPAGPPPAGNAPPTSRPSTGQSDRRKAAPPSKHPAGDHSHIPTSATPIFTILSAEMARVKARAPAQFAAQVKDTEKRLNLLYDHLNNEELLSPATVEQMVELAEALQARDFDKATAIQVDVHTNKVEECGNWMVGVKRLVGMSKAGSG